jgi:hypothetical protein
VKVRARSDVGFSLVEVVVAIAIFAAALVPLLYVAAAGQRLARAQPEAADLHQRLRVAADRLKRDLDAAGAGPGHGSLAASLGALLPAIVPARTGLRQANAELSAFDERLSTMHVPEGAVAVPLAASMTTTAAPLRLDVAAPGCASAGACGFVEGTRALILNGSETGAGYDAFTVTGINTSTGELAHDSPNPPFSRVYGAGSLIVPIVQHVYYFDRGNRRLILYDGDRSELPLIDNVLDVKFQYFGEADVDGSGLRSFDLAQLTDGPICGSSPYRFDADLLRIRMVRVVLRLQAAADDVRGNGPWFTRPGRLTSSYSAVPDYEVTFEVAPRNMLPPAGPR